MNTLDAERYAVEMKRRQLLLSMFEARLIREFGQKSRTVLVPQDPTTVTFISGYMMIEHPAAGSIHLKVALNEAFGVYCLELKNTELAEVPEMSAEDFNQLYPTVDPDDESDPFMEATETERKRFRDYDVRWQSHDEAMTDMSADLFEVIEWVLTEPYVKYQKKPFAFVQMMHAEYC